VIFISQAHENSDAQFMRLVSFLHTCRDLQLWTIPGLGSVWPFPQFMVTTHDGSGAYQDFKLVWKDFKGLGACYDTKQKLEYFRRSETVEKLHLDKVEKTTKMKYVWIFVIIIMLYLVGRLAMSPRKSPIPEGAAKSEKTIVSSLPVVPVAPQVPQSAKASERVDYYPALAEGAERVGSALFASEPLQSCMVTESGVEVITSPWARYRKGDRLDVGSVVDVSIEKKVVKVLLHSGGYLYITFFDQVTAIQRERWARDFRAKLDGTFVPKKSPAEREGGYLYRSGQGHTTGESDAEGVGEDAGIENTM